MAEPSSALSYYGLILRVAKETGMAYYGSTGQTAAIIPYTPSELADCKQIVLDGIRMFIADAPLNGWRWMRRTASVTFVDWVEGIADSADATYIVDATRTEDDDYFNGYTLYIVSGTGAGETATVTDFDKATGTITFSGGLSGASTPDTTSTYRLISDATAIIDYDPARYLLPQFFGGSADGPPTYAANSSRGVPLTWVDESFIREQRDPNVITSHPMWLAIRPYQPSSPPTLGSSRRFELIVDPSPSNADTIEFPYTVYFDDMQLEAGLATDGEPTTLVDSGRTEIDDYFNEWVITIVAGTGIHETATVTDYDQGTGTFTCDDGFSGGSTPDTTSVYIVQPAANLHPAGFMYDQAILSAVLTQAELQISEFDKGYTDRYYKIDLPAAKRIDARTAPRTLGNYHERCERRRFRERTWNDVTTDNDI